jgi:hypothetical protein
VVGGQVGEAAMASAGTLPGRTVSFQRVASLDGGAGTLPGRTATFQGLPSLDGVVEVESRDFVYSARLEADKFGRPAPVKHWPGLVLEDPSATAEAINAWASRAPTTGAPPAASVAAQTFAGGQSSLPPPAKTAGAAGEDSRTSWTGVRRHSSDGSTDETDGTSDGEYIERRQAAARQHPILAAHGSAGWDAPATNPLLSSSAAPSREETRQENGWFPNPMAVRHGQPQQPVAQQPVPAEDDCEGKAQAPVCPFCPAAYDEAAGAEPGRKTRRVRPKAVSRTTQKHGRWWQTLGYDGPAYCQRCSEVFRDHIIREKPNSAQCSRDHPCDECAGLLQHFTGGVDVLWQKIDARSYASDSKRKGATKPVQKKQRVSR